MRTLLLALLAGCSTVIVEPDADTDIDDTDAPDTDEPDTGTDTDTDEPDDEPFWCVGHVGPALVECTEGAQAGAAAAYLDCDRRRTACPACWRHVDWTETYEWAFYAAYEWHYARSGCT
jgi:hypothetical protein